MSRINILSENVSNRIAAGEVIERPASIVKELIENSIDAKAEKISVYVENAGTKEITVVDDGCGMDADDALLCLEPHATSKIRNEDDINEILTLGFRGEAIPSIASVSQFRLRTREQNALEGTEVNVRGGNYSRQDPAGCAPGTEIQVKNLFFNIPARKKFLKTPATEEKHIIETFYLLSLPHPNISFELFLDGRKFASSPKNKNSLMRIQNFFSKHFADSMLPVKYQNNGIKVYGYTARHGFTRNSRKEQRIFVNGRPVESLTAFRAIRNAYGSLVEKGRYPPVVIFLEMNPVFIDVNVHPAKREVRFRKSRLLSGTLTEAISRALRNSNSPTVNLDDSLSLKSLLSSAEVSYKRKAPEADDMIGLSSRKKSGINKNTEDSEENKSDINKSENSPVKNDKTKIPQSSQSNSIALPGSGKISVLGIWNNTYIIADSPSGILIIDQHAAHERVLFETLLKSFENGENFSQQLIFPVTIELSGSEALFINRNKEHFKKLGFDIENFSSNTIMINSIPQKISQDNIGGLIRDIISLLFDEDDSAGQRSIDKIAGAACKAAVKANDKLDKSEAESLIIQMSQCELPFSCPHGRPTIINISLKELEKRFGRR